MATFAIRNAIHPYFETDVFEANKPAPTNPKNAPAHSKYCVVSCMKFPSFFLDYLKQITLNSGQLARCAVLSRQPRLIDLLSF